MESNLNVSDVIKRWEVTSQEELEKALETADCIHIAADFEIDKRIKIEKSFTIYGNDHTLTFQESGSLYVQNTTDVTIGRLTLAGQGSDWENNLDLLTFDNVQKIFIWSCSFYDGADECLCFKNGSDYITIIGCTFSYTKPPITIRENKNHNFAILIGKDKNDIPESGMYHVRIEDTKFLGDVRRCPRIRNGLCTLNNCTFDTTSVYTIGPENSEIHLINCNVVRAHELIHKFGDYKCLIMKDGEIEYRYPKFSNFTVPAW